MAILKMCDKEVSGSVEIAGHHYIEMAKGLVVDLFENNLYDFSTFGAVVYGPATDTFERITYASTSYFCGISTATIDADEELKQKYINHLNLKEAERLAVIKEEEYNIPSKGKTVRVIGGRKLEKGTVGVVRWLGYDNYGNYTTLIHIGSENVAHYVLAKHVEVVRNF